MATYTENLRLKMPDQDDDYNIDDQNQNMRIIDESINNIVLSTERHVIATRVRDPSKPDYGIGSGGAGGGVVAVALEAAPYTGTGASIVIDGKEYGVNIGMDGDSAPDNTLIIKKTED